VISLGMKNIGVVLLAAGTSSRMGDRHKLSLPLADGRSVLEHSVAQAAKWQPRQLVVVMRPCIEELLARISTSGVEVAINEDYELGLASSLRVGISALRGEVTAMLVLLGDQPFISDHIVAGIVGAYEKEGKPVTIPFYGEVSGPPTLFGREMFPELLALSGDEGGRRVVRTDPARVARVVFPTEDMPPDIDTPEDYERYMNRAAP